jgi:hypothetical protein
MDAYPWCVNGLYVLSGTNSRNSPLSPPASCLTTCQVPPTAATTRSQDMPLARPRTLFALIHPRTHLASQKAPVVLAFP